ncbi:sensor histidine kinase [Emticicia sp. 17c]|uniref:sensor histidine kinase n=1 Tax=Emticicia sp. 17c TaxID=3127704 RepID=UPI00301C26D8
MSFSPRTIAFFLAVLITTITVVFLSFVPGVTAAMLFVVGVSCLFGSFFFVFYTIDILVFREVEQIYKTIQKMKIRDFDISRKSLIRSVNPIKRLNSEISTYVTRKQQEIDELKKMEQFRREFLADVSHELKTPIFAAQGFIHTLLDGAKEDPKVLDRFLNKAAKSLDGLDALVRDLVTLSQVEKGDLKMHFENIDIKHITEDIFEQLESKAQSRGVTLKIKPKDMQSAWVLADKQRISQVITNLVDNAIKYGKENGKIIVEIEEEKKYYQISVEDDGPGIAPEHLARIFERFYRIDKSRSRETGGTGLGLAIVKHILNAHHSKISVTSKIDKGTRFTFKLPFASQELSR